MKTKTQCDCGVTHEVDAEFVGTHDWWVCPSCLERKHREFVLLHQCMSKSQQRRLARQWKMEVPK